MKVLRVEKERGIGGKACDASKKCSGFSVDKGDCVTMKGGYGHWVECPEGYSYVGQCGSGKWANWTRSMACCQMLSSFPIVRSCKTRAVFLPSISLLIGKISLRQHDFGLFRSNFSSALSRLKYAMRQLPGALTLHEEGRVIYVYSPRSSHLQRCFLSLNRTRSERVCFSLLRICR